MRSSCPFFTRQWGVRSGVQHLGWPAVHAYPLPSCAEGAPSPSPPIPLSSAQPVLPLGSSEELPAPSSTPSSHCPLHHIFASLPLPGKQLGMMTALPTPCCSLRGLQNAGGDKTVSEEVSQGFRKVTRMQPAVGSGSSPVMDDRGCRAQARFTYPHPRLVSTQNFHLVWPLFFSALASTHPSQRRRLYPSLFCVIYTSVHSTP